MRCESRFEKGCGQRRGPPLILSFLPLCSVADPVAEWIRFYGGGQEQMDKSVVLTADGRLVIAGMTRSAGDPEGDLLLLCTELDGDSLWAQTYGGVELDKAKEIVQTDDGGFLVAGYSRSHFHDSRQGFLVRTDSVGTLEWSSFLGGSGRDGLFDLTRLQDGTYLAAGDYQTGLNNRHGWLIRFTDSGEVLWEQQVGGQRDTRLFACCQLVDGALVAAGWSRAAMGMFPDLCVIGISLDGSLLWARQYGAPGTDIVRRLRPLPDGGFILAGEVGLPADAGGSQVVVARLNAIGGVIWAVTYGLPWADQCSGLTVDGTQYAYVIGSSLPGPGGLEDINLARISLDGLTAGWLLHGSPQSELGRGLVLDGSDVFYLVGQSKRPLEPDGDIFLSRVVEVVSGADSPPLLDLHARVLFAGASGTSGESPYSADTLLLPVHPNPANGTVMLPISLPRVMMVEIAVYDLLGRRVCGLFDGSLSPGTHELLWDVSAVPSGVYFVRARPEYGSPQVQRVVVMK